MIYLVYECDSHREYKSFTIKMMSTSLSLAERIYNSLKKNYENDTDYFLNLAEYSPDNKATEHSDVLRELNELKTTENG